MKKILFTTVFLINVQLICAQTASTAENQIRSLEEREHMAVLKQDAATLRTIWATDFMVNAPFNRVTLSSEEVIDLVEKGIIKYSSFKRNIEEIMIKDDTAITMGSEEVVPLGEVPNAGEIIQRRYTNIWKKQEGQWRLIARHANRINP